MKKVYVLKLVKNRKGMVGVLEKEFEISNKMKRVFVCGKSY
jgi:hypothetical protein